jgi:hypothetical protein
MKDSADPGGRSPVLAPGPPIVITRRLHSTHTGSLEFGRGMIKP